MCDGKKDNDDDDNNTVVKYVGIALAVAGVVVKLATLFSGSGNVDKMMKAPGQPGVTIPRNVFESDPSSYFRNLRKS
ncbi:hypothetical protein PJK47_30575 [Mycobacterium kansasii]